MQMSKVGQFELKHFT